MAAGITDRLWSTEDVAALIDANETSSKKRGAYKKGALVMPMMREDDPRCRYALDCWIDPFSTANADATDYAANESGLRDRIIPILRAGRFKSLMLYRFNPNSWEWDEIEEFSADDLEDLNSNCDKTRPARS